MRKAILTTSCLVLAACTEPTASSQEAVLERRAEWVARELVDYSVTFRQDGFFNAVGGRSWRLGVTGGVVRTAVEVGTGVAFPDPTANGFLSVTQLFDWAVQLAANDRLEAITYDRTLGYPTLIQISGPPDASGTITLSNLERTTSGSALR